MVAFPHDLSSFGGLESPKPSYLAAWLLTRLYSRDLYLEQCKRHLFDGKGTYEYTENPKDIILGDVTRRLKNLLNDCFGKDSATKSLAQTITGWAEDSLERARPANFYLIWKLHKKENAQGVRSHPISNNIGYPTGQVSHFLHSQLIDVVYAHSHVLKDSLSLIRQQETLSFSPVKKSSTPRLSLKMV